MNTVLAFTRAAHYAGALLVAGELFFLVLVLPAGGRGGTGVVAGFGNHADVRRRRTKMVWMSLAIAVVADCIGLGAQAGAMSGLPWQQAIGWDTLSAVLGKTTFGRTWLWRLLLTGMLCIALLVMEMETATRG